MLTTERLQEIVSNPTTIENAYGRALIQQAEAMAREILLARKVVESFRWHPGNCLHAEPADCPSCTALNAYEQEAETTGATVAPHNKEADMPEIAEVTFPTEAYERLRKKMAAVQANNVKPDLQDETLSDAIAVIEHLESDAVALRNTIDFMRDRVTEAIRPR